MDWRIELDDFAKKDLAKLDKRNAQRITKFIRERLRRLDHPRQIGEALKGPEFDNLWRYRVGDYRLIARNEDAVIRVLIVEIGHRRDICR